MKQKIKTKILGCITVVVMIVSSFSGAVPAMAAELENGNSNNVTTTVSSEYAEEVKDLRDEIDALIADTSPASESYKTDYWGAVEVSGEHTGAWHSIYGNYARMCVAYKPLDGNGALSVNLNSGFAAWTVHYNPDNTDDDGYCMYVGPWKSITYAGAYRMNYQLFTTGGSFSTEEGEREGSFHVWIDYK